MSSSSAEGSTEYVPKPLRIAVVGSGIAGLSVAHLLSTGRDKHQVVIYEAASHLGMDSHGVNLPEKYINPAYLKELKAEAAKFAPTSSNEAEAKKGDQSQVPSIRVDVPLRVFTESYYPHLTGLYNECDIKFQAENYETAIVLESGKTVFAYNNFLLSENLSVPYVLPPNPFFRYSPVWSLDFWRISLGWLYFLRAGKRDLASGTLEASPATGHGPTILEYLTTKGYSEAFIFRFFLPMLAGICTCSMHAAGAYPARVVIRYLTARAMRGVKKVRMGTQCVVHRLTEKCETRLSCPVTSIRILKSPSSSSSSSSDLTTAVSPAPVTTVEVTDVRGKVAIYDHVIFACQANQTKRILDESIRLSITQLPYSSSNSTSSTDPASSSYSLPLLSSALGYFNYEASRLVLHTDPKLMPSQRRDWRSVNFILPNSLDIARDAAKTPLASPRTLSKPAAGASSTSSSSTSSSPASSFSSVTSTTSSEDDAESKSSTLPSQSVAAASPSRADLLQRMEEEGMASIWMNKVQRELSQHADVFQTWNPLIAPAKEHFIAESYFERPVVNEASLEASQVLWGPSSLSVNASPATTSVPRSVRRLAPASIYSEMDQGRGLQGLDHVWCVGSYSLPGVPLLETAVASAVKGMSRDYANQ